MNVFISTINVKNIILKTKEMKKQVFTFTGHLNTKHDWVN